MQITTMLTYKGPSIVRMVVLVLKITQADQLVETLTSWGELFRIQEDRLEHLINGDQPQGFQSATCTMIG